jgi:malonate decarboxylase beta subunit
VTRRSYYESTARQRIAGVLDAGSFAEILPPTARLTSPHLAALDIPVAFDDGVVVGRATLGGRAVLVAAQEGGFLGGAVGEIHGAKIVGILARAQRERPAAVLLLADSGGVRLQEPGAGLIAVAEIIRAILATRAADVAVIAAIGGACGCFGGMGIAVSCCSTVLMSEEGRLGLSGPEVIEMQSGAEEFDARDRGLVWRTMGGKHRYLLRDCDHLVDDSVAAFRAGLVAALDEVESHSLDAVEREHALLSRRLAMFGAASDAVDVWHALGWPMPEAVPLAPTDVFVAQARALRAA